MVVTKKPANRHTTRRQGAKREIPLTQDEIVTATFALIAEGGPDTFSMRSLATSLGVYPSALYWHVGSRSGLLGLVADVWLRDVVPNDSSSDWEGFVRSLASRYRNAALSQPNVARLLSHEIFRSGQSLRLPEAVIGQMLKAGLAVEEVIAAYNALTGAVVGFIDVELSQLLENDDETSHEIEAVIVGLDVKEYPNLVRFNDQLTNHAFALRWTSGDTNPMDGSFDYLIDTLILGIRQRVTA